MASLKIRTRRLRWVLLQCIRILKSVSLCEGGGGVGLAKKWAVSQDNSDGLRTASGVFRYMYLPSRIWVEKFNENFV